MVLIFYSTLLEMKWFSFILLFAIKYAITFITFNGLFHMFNISHPKDVQSNITHSDCYVGVKNFANAFLFTMETSQTIGYGTGTLTVSVLMASCSSSSTSSGPPSLPPCLHLPRPVESAMDYEAEATAICVNYQAKE